MVFECMRTHSAYTDVKNIISNAADCVLQLNRISIIVVVLPKWFCVFEIQFNTFVNEEKENRNLCCAQRKTNQFAIC